MIRVFTRFFNACTTGYRVSAPASTFLLATVFTLVVAFTARFAVGATIDHSELSQPAEILYSPSAQPGGQVHVAVEMARTADVRVYLPGLAAGGVQFQDRFGQLSHPGVSEAEMAFLAAAPQRMEQLLLERLPAELPEASSEQLKALAQQAVLDTQVSPTINLNGIFALVPGDVPRQRRLQQMLAELMDQLLR